MENERNIQYGVFSSVFRIRRLIVHLEWGVSSLAHFQLWTWTWTLDDSFFSFSRLIDWLCRQLFCCVIYKRRQKKRYCVSPEQSTSRLNKPPSHSLGLFIKCNNFNFAVSLKVIWIFFVICFISLLRPIPLRCRSFEFLLSFRVLFFIVARIYLHFDCAFGSDGGDGGDVGGDGSGGVLAMRAAYTKCRRLAGELLPPSVSL